jgi:hypothetical protein
VSFFLGGGLIMQFSSVAMRVLIIFALFIDVAASH